MDVQKHHPEEEKDKHHEEKKKKTPSGDYKQMNQCVKPVRGEDWKQSQFKRRQKEKLPLW